MQLRTTFKQTMEVILVQSTVIYLTVFITQQQVIIRLYIPSIPIQTVIL